MADPTAYLSTIAALAQIHRDHPEVAIVPAHCAQSAALARTAVR